VKHRKNGRFALHGALQNHHQDEFSRGELEDATPPLILGDRVGLLRKYFAGGAVTKPHNISGTAHSHGTPLAAESRRWLHQKRIATGKCNGRIYHCQ